MRKGVFFIFCLFSFVFTYAQETDDITRSLIIEEYNGEKYYIHFVKPGQTIYSISRVYNIGIDELNESNPNLNPDELKLNQVLKIPYKSSQEQEINVEPDSEVAFVNHEVKKQETLYGLSRKYGVSMDDILKYNPSVKSRGLLAGQVIRIPIKKGDINELITTQQGEIEDEPEEAEIPHLDGKYYTVQPGETLYALSKKLNVSMEELISLNPDLKNGTIAYQQIELPVKTKPVSLKGMIQVEKDTLVYYINHKIKRRQTIYTISREYSVRLDDIYMLNPELEDGISRNQIIKIPVYKPEDFKEVKSGHLITYSYKKEEKEEEIVLNDSGCTTASYNGEVVKVGLLLPFYLDMIEQIPKGDSINKIDPSDYHSFRFMQFYLGALLAADSLQKQGVNIELHVFDVGGTLDKAKKLVLDNKLSGLDLIIGPIYKRGFNYIASYARANEIPIVNPLSPRGEIISGNEFVFKVQPSLSAQLERAAYYIKEKYGGANIILVRQNQYQLEEEYKVVKSVLEQSFSGETVIPNSKIYNVIIETSIADTSLPENVFLDSLIIENSLVIRKDIESYLNASTVLTNSLKDIIFNRDSIDGILANSSIVRPNIILTLSQNKVFVMDFITRLNPLRDSIDIVLFGLPGWEEYDLESEYLLNLNYHAVESENVDYYKKDTEEFVNKFRSRFNTEPLLSQYAFDGFDIVFSFIKMRVQFGPGFYKCIEGILYPGLKYNFEFYKASENSGYENHSLRLIKYKDFRKIEINSNRIRF